MDEDQLTRATLYLLRDVLTETDLLRRHLPHLDIHPGQPRHRHTRKG